MVPTTPLKTKRQPRKGSAVGSIRICHDGCKAAYLGVANGHGLAQNLDRTWQSTTNHIAHFVIALHTNSKPNKLDMDHGVLPRNKIDMAFCLMSAAALMRNELREGPATAYRE